ncbi:MAG: nucleoside monophosphate kinase [Patescibacteria group bacterium]
MDLQTFIFIGRSGCGKGTQAILLREHFKKQNPGADIFYLETGAEFREFINSKNYSSELSARIYLSGDRQPDFLAIFIWSQVLIKNLKGGEHLIIDGTPRSAHEAEILHTALSFYERKNPVVIYLNISVEAAEERLRARKRIDDKDDKKNDKRLNWFETDVSPAIDFLKNNPRYRFLEVDGENSPEEIHEEIIKKSFTR